MASSSVFVSACWGGGSVGESGGESGEVLVVTSTASTWVTGCGMPLACLSSSVRVQVKGPSLWQSVQAWFGQSVWLQVVEAFSLVE